MLAREHYLVLVATHPLDFAVAKTAPTLLAVPLQLQVVVVVSMRYHRERALHVAEGVLFALHNGYQVASGAGGDQTVLCGNGVGDVHVNSPMRTRSNASLRVIRRGWTHFRNWLQPHENDGCHHLMDGKVLAVTLLSWHLRRSSHG